MHWRSPPRWLGRPVQAEARRCMGMAMSGVTVREALASTRVTEAFFPGTTKSTSSPCWSRKWLSLQVGAEPQSRRLRTGEHLGIAAAQHGCTGRLPGGQRQQLHHGRPASHGFRDVAHQRRLLRPGEKPAPGPARLLINPAADLIEDLRCVLDFIENCRQAHTIQKYLWIVPKAGHHIGILEEMVARLGKQMLQHPGLPRAPRPGEHQCRKAPDCLQNLALQRPVDVPHV